MHHEGAIPKSASRMNTEDNILSVGHGLRGLLPSIPGTMSLLSLSENKLEGHLSELHITASSTLFVHANHLSCQLPRHREVAPKASLALIGNHFTRPQHLPAWITTAERPSDMFCVSNQQGKGFILLLVCGGCFFLLSAVLLLTRQASPIDGKFALARSAWYDTCQQQNRLLLASCILLPSYSNMPLLVCTVVMDHLRFHLVGMRMPLQVSLVTFLHLCFLQSAARIHDRHVTQTSLRMAHVPTKGGLGEGHRGRR
eukprot:3009109-Amphidinium_carterae.1